MAENSGIEWTTHTFNPWIGCQKVSAACDHCYAEAWDNRFRGERWGPKAVRTRTKEANWNKPKKWNKQARDLDYRPRVFCASLADVFDNHSSIMPGWREDLWQLIYDTPNLDWLLLTKRPQNISRFLPENWSLSGYSNVWLGTTVEDQQEADRRLPHLLDVPAVVHFVSMEPLLGPVDLTGIGRECPWRGEPGSQNVVRGDWWPAVGDPEFESRNVQEGMSKLDWVIAGGESGANFRPVNPDWFRSLRDQCKDAGVPFLFKQWEGLHQKAIKAKGRELDGIVWNGYPEVLTSVTDGVD